VAEQTGKTPNRTIGIDPDRVTPAMAWWNPWPDAIATWEAASFEYPPLSIRRAAGFIYRQVIEIIASTIRRPWLWKTYSLPPMSRVP